MTHRTRTKIVATVGPASDSPEILESLVEAGASIFRLNFSHGDQKDHQEVAHLIRAIGNRRGEMIAILQDLQGPKLRVGAVGDPGHVNLTTGDAFRICTKDLVGDAAMVSTSYQQLARDLEIGDPVLIDDGRLVLEVTSLDYGTDHGDIVTTRVVHGGKLSSRKGINLPQTDVTAPALTSKDKADLGLGVELGVDMIALSFVQSPTDLYTAREVIAAAGGDQLLIAKIEKPQAIDVLPEIIDAADGVMVARGDLGVEISPEAVPLIQKRIIRLANAAGKPVITATQMLESMISSPLPTRAEASDVANAILDGTDAVMLSGETAVGDWSVESVATMTRIAQAIEQERTTTPWQLSRTTSGHYDNPTEAQAIGHAARALADDIDVKAIVVLTASGRIAQHISQERPDAPIIAFTERENVGRRLSLWHGVQPIVIVLESTIDDIIAQFNRELVSRQLAGIGDRIVIVGADPGRTRQGSVFLEVHTVDG